MPAQGSRESGAPAAVGDDAILARYAGRCSYCGQPIAQGDLIVNVAGEWLHDRCPEAPTDEKEGEWSLTPGS